MQGTFALTIEGRGFDSRVSPGMHEDFLSSECVSCGACVQACPTATLTEKSVIEIGQPEHSAVTTCAYCGVGCSFKAEMRGEELVRMVPWKDGKANRGHSCVKGRFAWGYATHRDRILNPMIRESIDQPWREVSWEEALKHTASEFSRIQQKYGRDFRRRHHFLALHERGNLSGPEAHPRRLRQQQCRHLRPRLPFADRLRPRPDLRYVAGTQDFDSVEHTDVVIVIGANPTDGHPVFGSRLKKRLRQGAKLIVIDPRRIDLVDGPHVKADYHLPLRPGTNVAIVTALAHVIVTEGLYNETFIRERCDWSEFQDWAEFVAEKRHSPEEVENFPAFPPISFAGPHAFTPPAAMARSITASASLTQPGLDHRHGHRQPRHGDRQYRPQGRRREPAARAEQCAGFLRHGFLPA